MRKETQRQHQQRQLLRLRWRGKASLIPPQQVFKNIKKLLEDATKMITGLIQ